MLTHPTSERLTALGLSGMARALDEQRRAGPTFEALGFEDRLGLLVDREAAERDTKRLTARLKFAALRQAASVEDLDLRTPRGIDRAAFAARFGLDVVEAFPRAMESLRKCDWVSESADFVALNRRGLDMQNEALGFFM